MSLICGSLHAAMDAVDIEIAANNTTILIGPDHKDLSLMTPAEREDVLRRLRIESDNPDANTRNQAEYVLLLQNDDETILRLLKAYHAGDRSSELGLSGAANRGTTAVLPYLIDDIYNGPTTERGKVGADVGIYSIRDASSIMFLEDVMRATAFSPETRDWAKAAYNGFRTFSHEQVLTQVKDWWEHNKEAILSKQYDKATWLPTDKASLNPVAASTQTPPTNPASPTPSPSPSSPSPLPWKLIVVVVAVLAAGAAAFKLRGIKR